jgi:hypothetical protein
MTAFGYEIYYRDAFKSFNSKTSQTTAENKLKKLFENLKIYDEDYNLFTDDEYVLNNTKVWIMYIVLVFSDMTINEIILIFNNSIKYDIDKVFMFEFFLIFLSKLDEGNAQILVENLPNEFRLIYFNNKKILQQIFDCNNFLNQLMIFLTIRLLG